MVVQPKFVLFCFNSFIIQLNYIVIQPYFSVLFTFLLFFDFFLKVLAASCFNLWILPFFFLHLHHSLLMKWGWQISSSFISQSTGFSPLGTDPVFVCSPLNYSVFFLLTPLVCVGICLVPALVFYFPPYLSLFTDAFSEHLALFRTLLNTLSLFHLCGGNKIEKALDLPACLPRFTPKLILFLLCSYFSASWRQVLFIAALHKASNDLLLKKAQNQASILITDSVFTSVSLTDPYVALPFCSLPVNSLGKVLLYFCLYSIQLN